MLINFSNHPYEIWREKQKEAAKQYGEVVDFPFPPINPDTDIEEMREMVRDYVEKIEAMKPAAVMAAGEFTLIFMLVDKLLQDGVKVICSCSRRQTIERKLPDGSNEKTSIFIFERFREYDYFTKRGEV